MNKLIRAASIATAALLLQACAPDQSGNASGEQWWRVTPVDISNEAASSSSDAPMVGNNSVTAGMQNQNQYQEAIDSTTVPVFRFLNILSGAHASNLSPANSYPWASDGEIFSIFVTGNSQRKGVYSCVNGGDYFSSNDPACEGRQVLGRIGFLDIQTSAYAPRAVYRCKRGSAGHMDTTNPSECTSLGYAVEGILGYAQ